jgi:hypothetical protein
MLEGRIRSVDSLRYNVTEAEFRDALSHYTEAQSRGDTAAMQSNAKEMRDALAYLRHLTDSAITAGTMTATKVPYVRQELQAMEDKVKMAENGGYTDTKVEMPEISPVAPPEPPPTEPLVPM